MRTTPEDTRRCFKVYKTSIQRRRRLIDVETKSCVYWNKWDKNVMSNQISNNVTQ